MKDEALFENAKKHIVQYMISNASSSFNKFWNLNILSELKKFKKIFFQEIACLHSSKLNNKLKNVPKTKNMTYVINRDEDKSVGIHWKALYESVSNVTYFDSFGSEHIAKDIKKFIGNKNITANIYRKQIYNSIICGYIVTDLLMLSLRVKY